MSFLFEELPERQEGRSIWFATIAEGPTDFNQQVYVIIPEADPSKRTGPCFWQARDSTSLPHRGDRCLVVWDNRHQYWVIAWWPYDT